MESHVTTVTLGAPVTHTLHLHVQTAEELMREMIASPELSSERRLAVENAWRESEGNEDHFYVFVLGFVILPMIAGGNDSDQVMEWEEILDGRVSEAQKGAIRAYQLVQAQVSAAQQAEEAGRAAITERALTVVGALDSDAPERLRERRLSILEEAEKRISELYAEQMRQLAALEAGHERAVAAGKELAALQMRLECALKRA